MLASAGEDGTVRLRDAGSGGLRQLLKLGPSGGCINGVVFTPDGRHLATANGNGTVYILRLAARASSPVPPQSIAQLPTDENKTHGSAPTATSDLDRPAAKAMLALGGMVAVRVNGQVREISASGGLPAETLELVRVTLSSADLQDEQLKPLRGLTNLIAIRLDGSRNVTNAALEHFRGMSQLESLEVVGTKIGDAGLARLGPLGLSHLLHVNLAGTLVSDAGMEHIAILENVRGLGLAYRPITDAGYRHLVNLKELRALLINDTRITDHGLPYLQQLPNLVTLSLSGTLVTEAGLAHLREFKQLNFLDLSDTRIRGPSLAQLRPLSELRFLGLYGLNVANSDLVHLTAFAQLDRVGLGRTRVTDLGLKTLKALTKLRYLDVGDTQVTQSAADELRKSLPECEIIVNTVSRPKKAGRTRRP
jgi:Leucine-rich repeat (LRR) protein